MDTTATYLDQSRLANAKNAYTTRRVDHDRLVTLVTGDVTPWPGDLLLARVVELGQHDKFERPDGRKSQLFVGDEILVAYGNRYAPDQFEAEIPRNPKQCHLVAGGGVAAEVVSNHAEMDPPTTIEPIGLVGDAEGQVFNLRGTALSRPLPAASRPFTVAVVGTSMNAGKTTSASYLVHGLAAGGRRVGAAKVTGTGAGKDHWLMADAGAEIALDFVDAGYPSTYKIPNTAVLDILDLLSGHLAMEGMDAVVLEVADGLYQRETCTLLETPAFRDAVDAVMFASGDAMGGASGIAWLRERDLPVCGLGGLLTASPLAMREAETAVDVPVFNLEALADAGIFERIVAEIAEPMAVGVAVAAS